MTDSNDDQPPAPQMPGKASRRMLLRLGAAAVPAAMTIKPAFAAGAASALNCTIPIPNNIDDKGKVRPAGTPGVFPPPPRGSYIGEEIKTLSPTQPVTTPQFNAHLEYIKKLRKSNAGYTCFASIARI